jgi:Flp pilus assembly protein TadB
MAGRHPAAEMIVLAGLTGTLTVAGILLAIAGLRPTTAPTGPASPWVRLRAALTARASGEARQRRTWQLVVALLVGGVAWLVTGWPIAALGAAAATIGLPWLTRRTDTARRVERLEALEQWTRRLADLLVVGSGIEQALVASVRTAPEPIAAEVGALAARLQARTPTEPALRAFADDLDDPAADLVASALILAARRRGRGLAQVLDGLARAVADEVTVRRGIDADRAKPRTTARAVTWIALGAAVALVGLDRSYVAPFGSPVGQTVLAGVLVIFAAAFGWMRTLASVTADHRFLPADPRRSSGIDLRSGP